MAGLGIKWDNVKGVATAGLVTLMSTAAMPAIAQDAPTFTPASSSRAVAYSAEPQSIYVPGVDQPLRAYQSYNQALANQDSALEDGFVFFIPENNTFIHAGMIALRDRLGQNVAVVYDLPEVDKIGVMINGGKFKQNSEGVAYLNVGDMYTKDLADFVDDLGQSLATLYKVKQNIDAYQTSSLLNNTETTTTREPG